ncbi:MAG: NAD(P)-dependent dehydrogenase (short-subunit alcohol dehydrogenase family) [Gammaproteobacteria bacterium]
MPGDVHIYELDVLDAASIAEFSKSLGHTPLDIVIHNAGISDRGHSRDTVFAVNAQAPFDVTQAILRNLLLTSEPRLLLMTSQLGARRGSTRPLGAYGDSKAELNDRFRQHAPGWKDQGITAIVLHPGWVRTDMGGPSAPLAVQESARGIRQVMCNLSPQDHGRFMTWKGEDHPW